MKNLAFQIVLKNSPFRVRFINGQFFSGSIITKKKQGGKMFFRTNISNF